MTARLQTIVTIIALSIVCPALSGVSIQILSQLQQDKMKWKAVCNKMAVSRFYRLKEWPWRFILTGVAAENFPDRMKRYT
jgi:hypothetical protein